MFQNYSRLHEKKTHTYTRTHAHTHTHTHTFPRRCALTPPQSTINTRDICSHFTFLPYCTGDVTRSFCVLFLKRFRKLSTFFFSITEVQK